MRFLIVEDEPASMKLLAQLLGPYGACDTAPSGEAALQSVERSIAERQPYDVICLDIHLGKMSGHEVLKSIRAAEAAAGRSYGAGARVVMTTAAADPQNVMSAFHRMCDGYLVKPVTPQSLFTTLRELGIDANPARA